jgi:lysophospholipase L1-like esterase
MSQTVAVTNANLFFSPYNVYSDGGGAMGASNIKGSSTYALMVNTGAYFKFKVTVAGGGAGDVSITLDTSRYNGLTASTCPTIAYSYNGRPFTTQLLAYSASPVTQSLATGLAAGTYTFEVHFKSVGGAALGGSADRWETPKYAVHVTGIVIDDTASIPSQTLRTKRMIVFGDSISEADNVLLANNDSANDIANASNDARRGWVPLWAEAFDCEYGIVAYGGQGWNLKGIGNATVGANFPALYHSTDANQSWNKYFKSTSRDLTSPVTPDYIIVMNGVNDGGSLTATPITALLNDIRSAVGAVPWIFTFDHGIASSNESTIATGTASAAHFKTRFVDIGFVLTAGETVASEYSGDHAFGGAHPNVAGHARIAAMLVKAAQDTIAAIGQAGAAINIGV